MASMSQTPEGRTHSDALAVRRLNAVLRDEQYGPLLARMNRADEARVLRLIDQGRGREARKLILELDEQRRKLEARRKKVRRYGKLTRYERKNLHPTNWDRDDWELYDELELS